MGYELRVTFLNFKRRDRHLKSCLQAALAFGENAGFRSSTQPTPELVPTLLRQAQDESAWERDETLRVGGGLRCAAPTPLL